MRRKLTAVLEAARAAVSGPPWTERETRYWRTVFPQMASWLPEAERETLRRAFSDEMERLGG